MIISVTERGTFRRCRRQWDYSSTNRKGITPLAAPTALAFGTLVHKIHEDWTNNTDEEKPIDHLVAERSAVTLAEIKKTYTERVGVGPDEVELSSFFEQYQLAQEMFANYTEKWGSPIPEGLELVSAEQTVVVPIPGTEHYHDDGRMSFYDDVAYKIDGVLHGPAVCSTSENGWQYLHCLEGTLDTLVRETTGARRYWIIDHKTFANHARTESLQMNDQFVAYEWIGTQLGFDVAGVIMDGMWKRTRFDKRGKERDLDKLFERVPIIHSPEEIANFAKRLRDEALDMADPDIRIYPNVPALLGCIDCQKYIKLCRAQERGEDVAYVIETDYTRRTDKDWDEEAADIDIYGTSAE